MYIELFILVLFYQGRMAEKLRGKKKKVKQSQERRSNVQVHTVPATVVWTPENEQPNAVPTLTSEAQATTSESQVVSLGDAAHLIDPAPVDVPSGAEASIEQAAVHTSNGAVLSTGPVPVNASICDAKDSIESVPADGLGITPLVDAHSDPTPLATTPSHTNEPNDSGPSAVPAQECEPSADLESTNSPPVSALDNASTSNDQTQVNVSANSPAPGPSGVNASCSAEPINDPQAAIAPSQDHAVDEISQIPIQPSDSGTYRGAIPKTKQISEVVCSPTPDEDATNAVAYTIIDTDTDAMPDHEEWKEADKFIGPESLAAQQFYDQIGKDGDPQWGMFHLPIDPSYEHDPSSVAAAIMSQRKQDIENKKASSRENEKSSSDSASKLDDVTTSKIAGELNDETSADIASDLDDETFDSEEGAAAMPLKPRIQRQEPQLPSPDIAQHPDHVATPPPVPPTGIRAFVNDMLACGRLINIRFTVAMDTVRQVFRDIRSCRRPRPMFEYEPGNSKNSDSFVTKSVANVVAYRNRWALICVLPTVTLMEIPLTLKEPPSQQTIEENAKNSIMPKENDEKYDCHICREKIKATEAYRFLPCEHYFHTGCIDPWFIYMYNCPLCRWNINVVRCGPMQRNRRKWSDENDPRDIGTEDY